MTSVACEQRHELLQLAGCGGDEPPAASAPASSAAPVSEPAVDPAAERYLYELGDAGLIGDYEPQELLALGLAFCDTYSQGGDPYAAGASQGDGSLVFDEVSRPVWATDVINVDLNAQQHLCDQ